MITEVAFIGVGEMGGPMCDHVLKAGFEVSIFDPDPVRVAEQVRAGATAGRSPAEAVAAAQFVSIVVRTDAQATEVMLASDGILSAVPTGSLIALHSTVAPTTVRKLRDASSASGIRFIDAPVSGAATGAANGSLYVMCGGAEEDINEAAEVIGCFSSNIRRFGATGAGIAAKLARNLAHYTIAAALDEATALAERSGVELPLFVDLVRESGMWAAIDARLDRISTSSLPLAGGEERIRQKFADLAVKDLGNAFILANECGLPTPIAEAVFRVIHSTIQMVD